MKTVSPPFTPFVHLVGVHACVHACYFTITNNHSCSYSSYYVSRSHRHRIKVLLECCISCILAMNLFVLPRLVKVPAHLSDELNRFPPSTTSPPATDVSVNSDKVLLPPPPPMSSPALKQNASSLSVLLDALDQNLAEQGVIVQPKGVCAPCSKPIVGQVSNVKSHLCLVSFVACSELLWYY